MRAGTLAGTLDEPAVVEDGAEHLCAEGGLEPAGSLLFEHLEQILADGRLKGVTKRVDLEGV